MGGGLTEDGHLTVKVGGLTEDVCFPEIVPFDRKMSI